MFIGWTVEDIYAFFKSHLRPPQDDLTGSFFSNFTFVVVDQVCVSSRRWQCIICCDAPDFGEQSKEIELKKIRMSLAEAVDHLIAFEELFLTPDEFEDQEETLGFEVTPPATLTFTAQLNVYHHVTLDQARKNRVRALRIIESPIAKDAQALREDKREKSESVCLQKEPISQSVKTTKEHSDKDRVCSRDLTRTEKNDIQIATAEKWDLIGSAKLIRAARLLGPPGGILSIHDNKTDDRRDHHSSRDAKWARESPRPVYSPSRRVYAPEIAGKEKPIIVSKGRDFLMPISGGGRSVVDEADE